MTNEELFDDLKQFITATVSQEVGGLRTELKADINDLRTELKADINDLRTELKADIKELDKKLDNIQLAIADTLTRAIESVDTTKQVQDHEQRLLRLEHRST